jgi:capsular polysaccharide biosynthesis protein
VNDPDQRMIWPADDLPDRLWVADGLAGEQESGEVAGTAGLVSLGFIKAALRRSAWFLCATAVAGVLIGYGMYTKYPPAYHATASVLLTDNPNQDPAVEVQTDVSLAQSQAVAGHAVQQLGLDQTVGSFQASYTVAVVSDQVLLFNVGASSSVDAVRRASALATDFLQFRADYARNQQQQLETQLDQQFNQARQQLNSINSQISQISAQPSSSAQQAELNNLLTQRGSANQIEQYVTGTKATTRTATTKMVEDSQVIDPAIAIPRSHLKSVAFYVAAGLVAGLAVGIGIVIISALVSDRLRRRDDIAEAVGAPVRLSVGTLRRRRWLPGLPWRAAKRKRDMRRVVVHLQGIVPGSSRGPASLAVVAVDDEQVAAQVVASLAGSYASKGKQVTVADLSSGAHLARLLGARKSGVHAVSLNGARFQVALPDRDDVAPVGPLPGGTSLVVPAHATEEVVAACASADLLLTLASLDPAFGADHLSTWATDAVAVVTAGQSSSERVRGVGEMLRLAGMRVDSVVLLGADKSDESLGVAPAPDESAAARSALRRSRW